MEYRVSNLIKICPNTDMDIASLKTMLGEIITTPVAYANKALLMLVRLYIIHRMGIMDELGKMDKYNYLLKWDMGEYIKNVFNLPGIVNKEMVEFIEKAYAGIKLEEIDPKDIFSVLENEDIGILNMIQKAFFDKEPVDILSVIEKVLTSPVENLLCDFYKKAAGRECWYYEIGLPVLSYLTCHANIESNLESFFNTENDKSTLRFCSWECSMYSRVQENHLSDKETIYTIARPDLFVDRNLIISPDRVFYITIPSVELPLSDIFISNIGEKYKVNIVNHYSYETGGEDIIGYAVYRDGVTTTSRGICRNIGVDETEVSREDFPNYLDKLLKQTLIPHLEKCKENASCDRYIIRLDVSPTEASISALNVLYKTLDKKAEELKLPASMDAYIRIHGNLPYTTSDDSLEYFEYDGCSN